MNTNTGVLTPQMFRDVFARVRRHLDVALVRASARHPLRPDGRSIMLRRMKLIV